MEEQQEEEYIHGFKEHADDLLGSFLAGKTNITEASFAVTFNNKEYQVYYVLGPGTIWHYRGRALISSK